MSDQESADRAARPDDERYTDEEAERRATEALRRSLMTPPRPQKDMVGKVGAPYRGGPKPRSRRPVEKRKDKP